jgi:hypothetical protein
MKMLDIRRLDPWLPPLLLMGVIFFFSAQPSLDSGLGVIDLVARKIVHFGVSSGGARSPPSRTRGAPQWRRS